MYWYKMKITRENYESFFIDYLEGTLDENMVDEFIGFIQENQDLKEELLLFDTVKLPEDDSSFENKNKLYREKLDQKKNFEQAAIALTEGDLTPEESKEFNDYLNRRPEKKKDLNLYKIARLEPETIVFSKKRDLYKKSAGQTIFLWTSRIAAVLVLVWIASVIAIKKPVDKNSTIQLVAEKNELKNTNSSNAGEKINTATKTTISNQAGTAIRVRMTQVKSNSNTATVNDTYPERESFAYLTSIEPKNAGLVAELSSRELAYMAPAADHGIVQQEKEEHLLADVIREKISKEGFSFKKLARSGLNLASRLTNEKFTYTTGQDGSVTQYAFETRLFGFSIPSGK